MRKLNLNLVREASFRVPMQTARLYDDGKELPPTSPLTSAQLSCSHDTGHQESISPLLTDRPKERNQTMINLFEALSTGTAGQSSDTDDTEANEQTLRELKIEQYKLEREVEDVSAQRNEYKRESIELKAENQQLQAYIGSMQAQIENIDYKHQLSNALEDNVRLLQQIDELEERLESIQDQPSLPDKPPVSEPVRQQMPEPILPGSGASIETELLREEVANQQIELDALREMVGLQKISHESDFLIRATTVLSHGGLKDQYCGVLELENQELRSEVESLHKQSGNDEAARLRLENAKLEKEVRRLMAELSDEKGAFEALIQMKTLPKRECREFM